MILRERGYFWNANIELPDTSFAPDGAIYGLLEVEDDGTVRLELDGLINGINSIDWNNAKKNESISIAGKLKVDASSVLIIDALNNGQTYSTNNISHEKYIALYCLKSSFEVEDIKSMVRSIHSSKTYCKSYNDMFGLSPIKFMRNDDGARVEYRSSQPFTVELDDRSFKIDHDILMPYGDERSLSSLQMECASTIQIIFDKDTTIEDVTQEHRMLQDLLMILSNIRTNIDWPIIKDRSDGVSATLYYLRGRPATETFERHNSWTIFPQVQSSLSEIVRLWFLKRKSIGSGIYLYLSTRRGVEMYGEQKFMTLMWGLEAFHRAVTKPPVDENIKAKIGRILDAVHPKDKRWLASRLSTPLEPSLDVRIYDLLKVLPLGLRSDELRALSETCRTIRNNVSHFGEASRGHYVVDNQRLSDLFRAMSYLYHARILFEIGVSRDHIRWIFCGSFRSSIIKSTLMTVGLSINEVE